MKHIFRLPKGSFLLSDGLFYFIFFWPFTNAKTKSEPFAFQHQDLLILGCGTQVDLHVLAILNSQLPLIMSIAVQPDFNFQRGLIAWKSKFRVFFNNFVDDAIGTV